MAALVLSVLLVAAAIYAYQEWGDDLETLVVALRAMFWRL